MSGKTKQGRAPGGFLPPSEDVRCAIYTRKSTEEGLEQDFNSLDNQREACEAYIKSQQGEGWVLVDENYDDGGFSGGSMERPALKRLLADVTAGRVNVVVVHRIDRLTRSILDFGVIVPILEAAGASFVSVTQQFSTSTSMGKLTLNVLLSFAQFERDLTTERIREKVSAHKKRGKWCGGQPPLGYTVDPVAKKLVIHPEEAALIRHIFKRYTELRSALAVCRELNASGHTTKRHISRQGKVKEGKAWFSTALYQILHNPVYIGKVKHKGALYPGEHEPVISQALWDEVQALVGKNSREPTNPRVPGEEDLLKGLIHCGHCQRAMTPTWTRGKGGKRYRYYVCTGAGKQGYRTCPQKSVPAGVIEEAVLTQVQALLRTPEVVVATWRELKKSQGEGEPPVKEKDVLEALAKLNPIWDELFPAERKRLVHLLVTETVLTKEGLHLTFNVEGLDSLSREVLAHQDIEMEEGVA